MGIGAGAHLLKDVVHAFKDPPNAKREPYSRERHLQMLDELDRHYSKNEGRDRGR